MQNVKCKVQNDGPARYSFWLVTGILVIGGLLPLGLYGLSCRGIHTVTPSEAYRILQTQDDAVLVDVREPDAFAAGHLGDAVNCPLDAIRAARSPDELPEALCDKKKLLLVCDVGVTSRMAARQLTGIGGRDVFCIRGGIQEWVHSITESGPGARDLWTIVHRTGKADGEAAQETSTAFHFRASPLWEQALAVLAFFILKPIYTVLSAAVIVVLWKSRAADLVALRWAMICFFVGENCCAANYFACKENSYLLEYLHGLGMAACFGFAAYAVLEAIDARIVGLSDPRRRCAALALCGECIKTADVPCGLKRTFMLIIPATIVVAMMLPTAGWQNNAYNTRVFAELYNYGHLQLYQQFENQYCAAAAVVLLAASLVALLWGTWRTRSSRHAPCADPGTGPVPDMDIAAAKILFAAGLGPLGFGMLRMVLGGAYDQNRVWFLFWEEATELLFVGSACLVLWIFRRRLLPSA